MLERSNANVITNYFNISDLNNFNKIIHNYIKLPSFLIGYFIFEKQLKIVYGSNIYKSFGFDLS